MPVLSLLVAAAIGWAALNVGLEEPRSHAGYWLRLWLSLGLGFGIASCGFFLWANLFDPSRIYVPAEIALLLASTGALLRRSWIRRAVFPVAVGPPAVSGPKTPHALDFLLCALLLSALLDFVMTSMARPHGGWDAWSIWNLRARFIFLGADRWQSTFSSILSWSHPDYPLLLPMLVARSWAYAGTNTLLAPALIAGIFTFATLGLLCSSLAALRGKRQGILAGIVLMGTPLFIEQGASQQADIPLGFYLLGVTACCCLAERPQAAQPSWLFVAGLMAGFSAWTKNEGLLFSAGLMAAYLIADAARRGGGERRMRWPFIAGGLLPVLALIAYFKLRIAPFDDPLLTQGLKPIVEKLGDITRYGQIATAFMHELAAFGRGIIPTPLVLIFYALLSGTELPKSNPGAAKGLAALTLVLAGYFFVYLVSPYQLDWHLKTSLHRLFVQLWPTVIFVFFLFVRPAQWTARIRG